MAFHLEHDRIVITQIDDAGILAGALDDLRAAGRQRLQPDARGFIRAVLRPHDRKDAEFTDLWFTSQDVEKALVFVALEAVLATICGVIAVVLAASIEGPSESLGIGAPL